MPLIIILRTNSGCCDFMSDSLFHSYSILNSPVPFSITLQYIVDCFPNLALSWHQVHRDENIFHVSLSCLITFSSCFPHFSISRADLSYWVLLKRCLQLIIAQRKEKIKFTCSDQAGKRTIQCQIKDISKVNRLLLFENPARNVLNPERFSYGL